MEFEGAVTAFLNGRLLTEAATMRYSMSTMDKRVKTGRRHRGFSRGAEECEATIEMPPPRDGFAVDWYEVTLNRDEIRLEWIDAGKRRQAIGRITKYESSKSEEETANVTLSFEGAPSRISLRRAG